MTLADIEDGEPEAVAVELRALLYERPLDGEEVKAALILCLESIATLNERVKNLETRIRDLEDLDQQRAR